jgi:hypothetical protein
MKRSVLGQLNIERADRVQVALSAMMTSDLIDCLVGDRLSRTMRLTSRFWLALGLGVLAAAILFMVGVGPRSDFAMPIHTLRFDLKFVEALALAFATLLLCFRLMRPDARIGTLALCLAASFLPPRARFSHNLIVTFRSLPPKRESMATDEVLCRRW